MEKKGSTNKIKEGSKEERLNTQQYRQTDTSIQLAIHFVRFSL